MEKTYGRLCFNGYRLVLADACLRCGRVCFLRKYKTGMVFRRVLALAGLGVGGVFGYCRIV